MARLLSVTAVAESGCGAVETADRFPNGDQGDGVGQHRAVGEVEPGGVARSVHAVGAPEVARSRTHWRTARSQAVLGWVWPAVTHRVNASAVKTGKARLVGASS